MGKKDFALMWPHWVKTAGDLDPGKHGLCYSVHGEMRSWELLAGLPRDRQKFPTRFYSRSAHDAAAM